MRLAILGVAVAYLLVGAVEASLHWYAGTRNSPAARSLRDWYLYRDPLNHKGYHEGFIDLVIPAVLLGLAAGSITARGRQVQLIGCVLILPLGVVALWPLYATFLANGWWNVITGVERTAALVIGYTKAALFCGFFACVGRSLTRYFQGR